MKNLSIREIYYYEHYYLDFFESLRPEIKKKFNWVLQLISTVERVPEKYFKHLSGTTGIFEIRIDYGSNTYRVFCFFADNNTLILMNVFQKKTNKTPLKELSRAETIKKRYLNEKTK
jgi:phage-related protein